MLVRVQLKPEAVGKFAELNAFPSETIFEVGKVETHPLGPPLGPWLYLKLGEEISKDPLSAKHFCVMEE